MPGLLIRNADYVVTVDAGRRIIRDGAVAVRDGRILAVGKTAEVTIGIPQGGMGQVTLEYGGERTTQIARSTDGSAVPPGTEVVITALRGDSVIVERAGTRASGGSK